MRRFFAGQRQRALSSPLLTFTKPSMSYVSSQSQQVEPQMVKLAVESPRRWNRIW